MKIAICGAHGVGKTTISSALSKALGLSVLPDIVVDAFRLGFVINEKTPIETQVWLTGKQIENERVNAEFIADKCIFDYYVYAKALSMEDDVVSVTQKVALKNGKYDIVFFIRPEFPIPTDGELRSVNPEFQKAVATAYENFLVASGVQFTILTGSVEDRLAQALAAIEKI